MSDRQKLKEFLEEKLQLEKDKLRPVAVTGGKSGPKEIRAVREKLEVAKERCLSRKDFPPVVIVELEGIEKDLAAYDPDFVAEILRQLAEAMIKNDGNDALKLRYARSIMRTVRSGDPMEMQLVVQMIAIHHATLNHAALLGNSKDLPQSESYANILNKSARTYTGQMGALKQWRSGPEPKFMVSVNDGGQAAFVGHLSQNGVDEDKADGTKVPPLLTDQPGTAMPIVQTEEESAATVPRIEQDQPAPSITRRKRRS